jgi:hypothetical protein
VSPIPDRSPFKAGDRVQMHGYPGYPGSPNDHGYTGFRGAVKGYIGATILTGTTDNGKPWAEYWGALQREGEPNRSACLCTCCPAEVL